MCCPTPGSPVAVAGPGRVERGGPGPVAIDDAYVYFEGAGPIWKRSKRFPWVLLTPRGA